MNSRKASVKLSLVIDVLRDDWSSKALDQLVVINLLEVKQYLDALGAVSAATASAAKPNGGKLRSRIQTVEAENKELRSRLKVSAAIIDEVIKAGKAPNRYIPADVLHRASATAKELQAKGLVVNADLTGKPKGPTRKKGKKAKKTTKGKKGKKTTKGTKGKK